MAIPVPGDCVVQGDSDLYGIGVRIGLYTQWLATLLTTLFESRDEDVYRIANLIIQASVFLGLVIESHAGSPVVGAVITQYLLAGSLSSLTGDGISHMASITGLIRLLFYLAFSSYGVWFWFRGVAIMSVPGCAAHEIAFFGSVTVHGWFRGLGKAVSCVGMVLCVALIGLGVYRVVRRFRGGFRRGVLGEEGGQGAAAATRRRRPRVEVSLLVLSMALIACSIYLIEHLIRVNDVQGVGPAAGISVGQLIPLLAGAMACGLTLWKIIVHRLFRRKHCWYLFGYHL